MFQLGGIQWHRVLCVITVSKLGKAHKISLACFKPSSSGIFQRWTELILVETVEMTVCGGHGKQN